MDAFWQLYFKCGLSYCFSTHQNTLLPEAVWNIQQVSSEKGSPGAALEGGKSVKGPWVARQRKSCEERVWVSLSSHYESLSNFSLVFWERHLYYFVTARCVRWKLAIYLSEIPVNVTTWHCEVPGSETQDLDVAGKIWRKIFQLKAVVWFKVKNMVFQTKKDSSSTFCHLPIAWSWVCKLQFILS